MPVELVQVDDSRPYRRPLTYNGHMLAKVRAVLIAAGLLVAPGCRGDQEVEAIDAALLDAAPIDASDADAPEIDAAGIDATAIDAPGMDTSDIDTPDVDTPDVDAAGVDAAGVDAAALDAAGIDASPIDAGPPVITRYDYGGNGVSSILVGDNHLAGIDAPQGQAYLYGPNLGGPLLTFFPNSNNGPHMLGSDVAMVEDLSGDGLADLVMGDVYDGYNSPGVVYVYDSSTGQTARILGPFTGSNFGYPIASIGDTNGDRRSEFAVGNRRASTSDNIVVFSGATRTVLFEILGRLQPGVGDIDGDGAGDIAFTQAGRVQVVAGDDRTPLLDVLGMRAGPVGDVDHDGHPDVVVADGSAVTVRKFVAGNLTGSTLVSFMAANTVRRIARVGDLDLDGTPDVLVDETTSVAVYSGTTGVSLWSITVDAYSIAGPGDQNNDGHPDIAVGCSCYDAGPPATQGRVTVYSGANGAVLADVRQLRGTDVVGRSYGIGLSSGF